MLRGALALSEQRDLYVEGLTTHGLACSFFMPPLLNFVYIIASFCTHSSPPPRLLGIVSVAGPSAPRQGLGTASAHK